jgi:hypothetical protein
VNRFLYFDYRGTRPPTIRSSYREPYHFVVQVSETESDGKYRSSSELQKAAAILIRNAFDERFAEIVISAPEKAEITREEFSRMRTIRINLSSLMPGGVYGVLARLG